MPERTKGNAAANEALDIAEIIRAIHERLANGLKIMASFKEKFNLEITDARARKGSSRGTHYDFEILVNGEWKHVEHKGSKKLCTIKPDEKPWAAGVQFANMGCEKWSIAKKFARIWYDMYIGSGEFKKEWNLTAPIPTFDEWFKNDCKVQGDPKTPFGIELKKNVKEKGASLLKKRAAVLTALESDTAEIEILKKEALQIANVVLEEKDYWMTIRGDLKGEFNVAWFPKFTIESIDDCIRLKCTDFKCKFQCANGFTFNGRLRWGKGPFSNLRLDLK
jgi:hypothetical protein